MSIWYRVSHNESPVITFTGEGGLHVAGRWNHLGRRAIYCSESISLCTLEWLANHGLSVSGFNYYRYSIEIPDKLLVKYKHQDLPSGWNNVPATDISRDFAEEHLFETLHFGIIVPSVIVPEEYNLVLNPAHTPDLLKMVSILGPYLAPKR